jgi:type IV secretion system protein TrbL
MVGFTTFFDNILTVLVLLFAWFVVVLAFFILAVQLFVTVLEFKLTTLAGFVLVPFALWNKSSFLAERVLGNVISSGIKVMVLAVIVGIGASFFGDFTNALNGQEPSFSQAMSLVLAAITLFGIGIFGPGIAAGLVSGAPQLGAGAAIGTAGGLAAGVALTGGAVMGGARLGVAAVRSGTSLGAGAATAYRLGQATSGETGMAGVAAGVSGVARAGASAMGQRLLTVVKSATGNASEDAREGTRGAWQATGGQNSEGSRSDSPQASNDSASGWAKTLRTEQRNRQRAQTAVQTIKDGDKGGGAANPDLSEQE